MRKLNLLLSVCLLASGIVFAQNSAKQTLKQTEYPSLKNRKTISTERHKQIATEIAQETPNTNTYFNIEDYRPSANNRSPKTMKAMKAGESTEALHILDSMVIVDMNGDNYYKIEWHNDTNNWPIREAQYSWNPYSGEGEWVLTTESVLEWEKRGTIGYLKSHIITNSDKSSSRTEYTYNSDNLGDSEITSKRQSSSSSWVNLRKNIYGYTGTFPEPTHLDGHAWDGSTWIKDVEEDCIWDEWGRQIYFEGYFVDGTTKTGNVKESRVFLPYDFPGSVDSNFSYQTELLVWVWMDDEWKQSGRSVKGFTEIDEFGSRHVTYDSNLVLNPETGEIDCYDFGGGLSCGTVSITEWDGGRELSEQAYIYDGNSGEFEAQLGAEFTWSKTDSGQWQMIRVMSWAETGVRYDSLIVVFGLNKPTYHWNDMAYTYYKYWMFEEGAFDPKDEEERLFDSRGNEIEWYIYQYYLGEQLPLAKHLFTYDENNRLLEVKNYIGADDNILYFYSTSKYEWLHDAIARKYIFFEDVAKASGASDYGKGYNYDYSVTHPNILARSYFESDIRFGTYEFPFKLNMMFDLEDNGIGFDTTYKYIYYWTVSGEETANENPVIKNREVAKVYPNPVKNILNIESEENIKQIVVLDMQGRVVLKLQGNNRQVDMNAVAKGNYVVRIQTDKGISSAKIVKH